MLMDKINVMKWFRAKSPSLTRCKEGDLLLLNFSNLTCVVNRQMGLSIDYQCIIHMSEVHEFKA